MRRLIPLLFAAAALAAAGCGGRAAVKAPKIDADAIKARAGAAHAALDAQSGIVAAPKTEEGRVLEAKTGTSAPQPDVPQRGEAEIRQGKILGKDPEGCTWLEGDATVLVGEQDSPHQARAMAIEQARAAAVQDFLGVDVNSKFMDFEQEGLRHEARLTESLLQTTRNGRIIKESVLDAGYIPTPDCPYCRYHVKMKACVLPRDTASDKNFRVELQISRTRFVQGDEAKITVTATRDCSVYLYDVYDLGDADKTALVVPNEAVPSKTLKAGESWDYPDDDAKKRGVKLIAELPNPSDEVSAEVIRVVATVTPLPSAVYDPTDGGYLGVLRRLNRSRTEWAEDAEAYTIYKK